MMLGVDLYSIAPSGWGVWMHQKKVFLARSVVEGADPEADNHRFWLHPSCSRFATSERTSQNLAPIWLPH